MSLFFFFTPFVFVLFFVFCNLDLFYVMFKISRSLMLSFWYVAIDLAFQIIHIYKEFVNLVDKEGDSPLHILARKPSAFETGSTLGSLDKKIYGSKYPFLIFLVKVFGAAMFNFFFWVILGEYRLFVHFIYLFIYSLSRDNLTHSYLVNYLSINIFLISYI